MTRLNQLKRKLIRNNTYRNEYTHYMQEMPDLGHAERALDTKDGPEWYIPHHGVYHPRKKQLRVVFDRSARFQGSSLNDQLVVGPDLINNLVGVLCSFRQHPIAIMCDIEKMFHQFRVNKEHRDLLRFLWWENWDMSSQPIAYRMKVHLFSAMSSPGCANYGLKHLAKESRNTHPLGADFIERNFYVDDGLTSEHTEERAKRVIEEARAIWPIEAAQVHLHQPCSHGTGSTSGRASNVKDLDLSFNELLMERVLAVQWSVESDELRFSLSPTERPTSRRNILATVALLHDTLGLIAPYLLQGGKILQDMCGKGIGRDDPPPADLLHQWETWQTDLDHLKDLRIPRCYYPEGFGPSTTVQLHHFSDANTAGYGMYTHLRIKKRSRRCALCSRCSKGKSCPSQNPHSASARAFCCSYGSRGRLNDQARAGFHCEWRVLLGWFTCRPGYLNNEARRFHVFIANRVQKIRQLTDSSQWHYVPIKSNPADYASHGLSAKEIPNICWFSGPTFLWENDIQIADQPAREIQPDDPEVRSIVLQTQAVAPLDWNERLAHCSSWAISSRVVARILRLTDSPKRKGQLTPEEISRAESRVIKGLQWQTYPQEMKCLSAKNLIPASSSLHHLDALLHDSIIRVGGRLKETSSSLEEKHPIILPKRGHITTLIIDHFHKKTQHQGRGITLNMIRSKGYKWWQIYQRKEQTHLPHSHTQVWISSEPSWPKTAEEKWNVMVCYSPAIALEPFASKWSTTSRFAGARYFSKLDAKQRFWQLRLDDESSYRNTPRGRGGVLQWFCRTFPTLPLAPAVFSFTRR